jgi:hypothetical protein
VPVVELLVVELPLVGPLVELPLVVELPVELRLVEPKVGPVIGQEQAVFVGQQPADP